MSDKFDKPDNQQGKEIDDFLAQFDKLNSDFNKNSGTNTRQTPPAPTGTGPAKAPQSGTRQTNFAPAQPGSFSRPAAQPGTRPPAQSGATPTGNTPFTPASGNTPGGMRPAGTSQSNSRTNSAGQTQNSSSQLDALRTAMAQAGFTNTGNQPGTQTPNPGARPAPPAGTSTRPTPPAGTSTRPTPPAGTSTRPAPPAGTSTRPTPPASTRPTPPAGTSTRPTPPASTRPAPPAGTNAGSGSIPPGTGSQFAPRPSNPTPTGSRSAGTATPGIGLNNRTNTAGQFGSQPGQPANSNPYNAKPAVGTPAGTKPANSNPFATQVINTQRPGAGPATTTQNTPGTGLNPSGFGSGFNRNNSQFGSNNAGQTSAGQHNAARGAQSQNITGQNTNRPGAPGQAGTGGPSAGQNASAPFGSRPSAPAYGSRSAGTPPGVSGQNGLRTNPMGQTNMGPSGAKPSGISQSSPDAHTSEAYAAARKRAAETAQNSVNAVQKTRMERLNESKGPSHGSMTDKPPKNKESSMASGKSSKRKKKKKYSFNRRQFLKFILGAFIAGCLILGAFVISIIATSPKIEPDKIYSMLSENSILYDDSGNEIDSLLTKDGMRTNVVYKELPKNLVDAFVAVEDKTFWKHHGFNFVRILGAIKESLFEGGNVSGTSTITQQLARNLYLAETKTDYSLVRKIREAYYALLLERHLSKEQIIEAYLNTIYLGYTSYGVQAASQAYFSKDVSELTLPECAALASLAKAPDRMALIKRYPIGSVDTSTVTVLHEGNGWIYAYNDSVTDRKALVLQFMKEQELISDTEYSEAVAYDLKDSMKPGEDTIREVSSYFVDYVIEDVTKGIIRKYSLKGDNAEQDARQILYNGGLRIYTTMNQQMQTIAETEFSKNENFPKVYNLQRDGAGNIVGSNGKILLYSYNYYFDNSGNFTLNADEYRKESNGDLILYGGKRLRFNDIQVEGKTDHSIEFRNFYEIQDGVFYTRDGGVLQVPLKYKNTNSNGDLIIKSSFFEENPGFFLDNGSTLTVASSGYILKQQIVQPQSAMVIYDFQKGGIKAMVGGRNIEGRQLFNRAVKPRQPGSSIKPIGAYGPALQNGADGIPVRDQGEGYGKYWTASSGINDEKMIFNGKAWPKNWYSGFRGLTRMRVAVEQSINTTAVKVVNDIGVERSIEFAKSLGITSIVESGDVNDKNPAAMALGGMTYGVSPLEMVAAYGTFANQGTYVTPVSYTKVTDKNGNVIIDNSPSQEQVMDPGAAYIMTDMMRTAVTAGIAGNANISGYQVAGKTGTTTDNYDAWFVGYTPQYAAAVWIGNDINIELDQGSAAATKVWANVMRQIHSTLNLPTNGFVKPDNVVSMAVDAYTGMLPNGGDTVREYFVKGTQPSSRSSVSSPVTKEICSESGKLATPECPNKTKEKFTTSNAPSYYCDIHNSDTTAYPTGPVDSETPEEGTGDTTGGGVDHPGTNPGGQPPTTPPTTPPVTPPTTPPTDPVVPPGNDEPPEWLVTSD